MVVMLRGRVTVSYRITYTILYTLFWLMNQEAEGGCGYYLLNIYHLTYNADLEDKHTGWPKKKLTSLSGNRTPVYTNQYRYLCIRRSIILPPALVSA
jgi:hypothetical protein